MKRSGMRSILHVLVRWLGLPGSWTWACRQLDNGAIIRPASATGAVQYRLDTEAQRRLEWRFGEGDKWVNANFFLNNRDRTDWVVVPPNVEGEAR
jgi:hypothetical protein